MKHEIKAIFLDVDDTLLDFDAYCRTSMAQGFAHFGLGEYRPEMYPVFQSINAALWRQIEDQTLDFATLQKIRWNRVFDALGIDFDGPTFETYFRACLYDSAIPVPGARALLDHLRGRYLLCAASNGPYEQQLHRLEIGGMREDFDAVYISEDLGASKPSAEFFDRAFARLNAGRAVPIAPGETVMLGDSLTSDIRGGLAAGMHTIWFDRWGRGNASGIAPEQTVRTLEEVFALL